MNIIISKTKHEMGQRAALLGSQLINEAIARKGNANIVVATGTSQLDMLSELVKAKVDWSRVTGFHLDEYIGLSADHPASFRKYLKERFVEKVDPGAFHYIDGEQDIKLECDRLGRIIQDHPIDVSFVGIGENGHLAFNDPPADFNTREPFLTVDLDEACRRQQLNEGWFKSLTEVPLQAISMSIHQIMLSGHIICTVPDQRKSTAVSNALYGPVTPEVPASKLQEHSGTYFFLDLESSSRIPNKQV